MSSSLPIFVTKLDVQIECIRVVKWSAAFHLAFQLKIRVGFNVINQLLIEQIQITPAQPPIVYSAKAKCHHPGSR
jgi:hypothetical protein